MDRRLRTLYLRMIDYDAQPDLIQHLTKVHSYARLIGEEEGMPEDQLEILEAAALVHDIGIPECDRKYGSHPGHLQEKEGPPLARRMLTEVGFPPEVTGRVCTLVGEHHTLSPVDGLDHQILLEADFIVNSLENAYTREKLEATFRRVFVTGTGRRIYSTMFGLPQGDA